jgi:hypothetical protein
MFVMRLSHCGRAFHVAYGTQAQEAFLEGHVLAFCILVVSESGKSNRSNGIHAGQPPAGDRKAIAMSGVRVTQEGRISPEEEEGSLSRSAVSGLTVGR